jgi:hypothetical protein
MQTRSPKLFDLVAVLNPATQGDLQVGDVGTVVELFEPDAAELEFLDKDGRTRCIATFQFTDLLVLNRERTPIG